MVKITVASDMNGYNQIRTGPEHSLNGTQNTHVIQDGNAIISVQVLRKATEDFAPKIEIGRGGFGAVYKGELEDGTKLAVKRMEAGVVSNKAVDEFQAEIGVLSKVRHRHLVSLFGYSIEGNERLLVYEYMPQGALSRHLFRWKNLNLKPLSWARRLTIALDVARGMEYLHNLARQSFIHRDLKSSNILLGDDFRAKVSDFGLVKLAPDRERSIATRLAGTFGYLAPEYAVTGKITTKADVFSFGVVLMELLTGLMALDEHRSAETRYLAEWFTQIKSDKKKINDAVDPTIDAKEENFDSISIVADLAGHCTARDPNHRPDMGHVVSVLVQLVEKWIPFDSETEDLSGIDYNLPLTQMLKDWKLCIWSTDGWEKQTTRQLQIPAGRAAAPLADTRVQFHQDQTHLIAVHETQIAIYEAPKLECLKQDKWSSAYDVRTILISIQSLLGAFLDIMGKESKITKEDAIGLLKEMQENGQRIFWNS